MVPLQRACDVENLTDFSRYYQGSYVGFHSSDAAFITPCYVGGMIDMEHAQLRPLSKGEGGRFTIEQGFGITWSKLKEQIDFGLPDIGMTPEGPTVLFTSYTTPRVAKKGYRDRDTRSADFNTWAIRKKYAVRNNSARYDWVWFAFNPDYKSLEQAEDILNKGDMVGVPLSRTLAVYSLPKFRNSLLAYKRWTVGHIISPFLINLKKEYADYEGEIARQTGAEVVVG